MLFEIYFLASLELHAGGHKFSDLYTLILDDECFMNVPDACDVSLRILFFFLEKMVVHSFFIAR